MDDIYKKVAQSIEKKGDHYDILAEEYPDITEELPIFKEEMEEPEVVEPEPFSFTVLTLITLGLLAVLCVVIDISNK